MSSETRAATTASECRQSDPASGFDIRSAFAGGGPAAFAALQTAAGNRAVGALLRAPSLEVARCGAGAGACGCDSGELDAKEHAGRSARVAVANLGHAAAARRERSERSATGRVWENRGPKADLPRRVLARQTPAAGSPTVEDPLPYEGVPMEKWWPGLEEQYRMRGDDREADAIRACRLLGGEACARILTITEVHALLEVANTAGGDPAKLEEGLDQSPLLAGFAAVKVAPRGAPTPPQLGLVMVLYMIAQYQQLQDLDRFQETLTKFDYVILDAPQSVYCQGCHPVRVPTEPASSPYVLADTRYPRWATEEQRRLIDSGLATWSEESGWNGPTSEFASGGLSFQVRGFGSAGLVPPRDPGASLSPPGALYLLAQHVHDPTGTSLPMRIGASAGKRITPGPGITQQAVAIAEVELPGGGRAYLAAGRDARLSPEQVRILLAAGIPIANILTGASYRTANPLDNHAEQVILRHLPRGARIVRWGISWAGPLKGEPCGWCAQHGVDVNLVETSEMAETLLGI